MIQLFCSSGVVWGGVKWFFFLVYICTEEFPLVVFIVIYVFFKAGSPTSCCAWLGPQLALLTGSVFIYVGAHKPSSSACSSGDVACHFSTSYPCSVPPSVISPLIFL